MCGVKMRDDPFSVDRQAGCSEENKNQFQILVITNFTWNSVVLAFSISHLYHGAKVSALKMSAVDY